jgi:hypothetical protein
LTVLFFDIQSASLFTPWEVQVAKDDAFLIRLSEAEKSAFKDAARLAGIGLSTWARERLRLAAIRELETAAKPIAFLNDPEDGADERETD